MQGANDIAPWDLFQCIPFQGPLPRTTLVQAGWKEYAHPEVMKAKEKIETIESQEEWELRKKLANPYEAVYSTASEFPFPSLASFHPLSRSYFKMLEMMETFGLWTHLRTLVSKTAPFRSAHACEGPGGFLQYIVQQAKKEHFPVHSFHAITLKPTKTHIPGWRRSIHFLKEHPQIQLHYGKDGTGDLLLLHNQQNFAEQAKQSLLFTADGGFDFSVNYSQQERQAFPLLLASFTTGLMTLAKGGCLIIKCFDIYSPATQDLLLGTARLFERFTIYKPATSRPCNSERYFVAIGFVGQAHPSSSVWIRHLQDAQVKHKKSPLTRLVDSAWSSSILLALQEQIRWQEDQQLFAIQKTLSFSKDDLPTLLEITLRKSKEWCKRFGVSYCCD